MAMRIAHANVQVSDAQASLTFYRALGLELSGCLRLDPVVLLYMTVPGDASGPTLELAVNPNLRERAPGSGHLALAVGDLDELVCTLRERGIQLEGDPFHPGGREDLRVCFAVDPDGTRVELIEGTFPTPKDALPAEIAASIAGVAP
jgi:lactoylglutathione lyase